MRYALRHSIYIYILDMYRCRLIKPHVSVNSTTLIEPPFGSSRINVDHYHIVAAIIQKIGYIILKRRVSALMMSDKEIIDVHTAVTIHTVKRNIYPPPQILLINVKMLPVPADILLKRSCCRMYILNCVHLRDCVITSELLCRILIWRALYYKVMRQFDLPPSAVIIPY